MRELKDRGVCRHRGAGRAHHGRHPQPQRLPAAPGAQGQAPKKIPLTDAIFANLRCKDDAGNDPSVTRVSIDCQATVNMGRYSRGGMTRGGHKAADHDMGCREKYTLFGAVNENSRELYLHVGSSAKTSDFIVDGLQAWWEHSPTEARERCSLLLIKVETSITGWSKTAYFARRSRRMKGWQTYRRDAPLGALTDRGKCCCPMSLPLLTLVQIAARRQSQRSSSCVEGRNGFLALHQHGHHRSRPVAV